MRVPIPNEPLAIVLAKPTLELARTDVQSVVSRAELLRGKLQVRRWSESRRASAQTTLRGLEHAVALYSELPGDAALRVVKAWTHTATYLLGELDGARCEP